MFNKFVKEIFNESGLKDEGFAYKDKSIFISPIEQFLLEFYFSLHNGDHFYLTLVIVPLYEPQENAPLTYSWRLKTSPYKEMFMWNKNENKIVIKNEILKLISESKQILIHMKTPMDFYNKFNNQ